MGGGRMGGVARGLFVGNCAGGRVMFDAGGGGGAMRCIAF